MSKAAKLAVVIAVLLSIIALINSVLPNDTKPGVPTVFPTVYTVDPTNTSTPEKKQLVQVQR